MSRSNPNSSLQNPSSRWFRWDGAEGHFSYWDREAKEEVDLENPVSFVLLDTTSTVAGWHERSKSGIYSNEVRDTRTEPLVVKAKAGGVLGCGVYKEIREQIVAHGAHFVTNAYVGYVGEDGALALGVVQFKGAALNAWVEFCSKNRKAVYEKAFKVTGALQGKKGKIVFFTPTLAVQELKQETANEAWALDKQLQDYFKEYFSKPKSQAAQPAPAGEAPQPDAADTGSQPDAPESEPEPGEPEPPAVEDDDVPF